MRWLATRPRRRKTVWLWEARRAAPIFGRLLGVIAALELCGWPVLLLWLAAAALVLPASTRIRITRDEPDLARLWRCWAFVPVWPCGAVRVANPGARVLAHPRADEILAWMQATSRALAAPPSELATLPHAQVVRRRRRLAGGRERHLLAP